MTTVVDGVYDDGHWRVSKCPDDKGRIHVANHAHQFPQCWAIGSLESLQHALLIFLMGYDPDTY